MFNIKLIKTEIDLTQAQQDFSVVNTVFAPLLNTYPVYIVGDLHGSFIKLISVLIHFGFVKYHKDPFVVYEELFFYDTLIRNIASSKDLGTRSVIAEGFAKNFIRILNENFIPNIPLIRSKKIVFLGDTMCDRGASDFITLLIFHWLSQFNFNYSVIIGNHELLLCTKHLLAERHLLNPADTLSMQDRMFQSFDYPYLPVCVQKQFKQILHKYLSHLRLFEVFFAPEPVLLTHAPCTADNFDRICTFYNQQPFLSYNSVTGMALPILSHPVKNDLRKIFIPKYSASAQNLFHNHVRNLFGVHMSNPRIHLFTHEVEFLRLINNFCWNRDLDEPIFASSQRKKSHNGLFGKNIFGHMGSYYTHGKALPVHSTQICIDRITGMPSAMAGPVVYGLLDPVVVHEQ